MRHSRPNTAQRLMCGAAAIAILSFASAAQAEERAFTIEPQSLSTALAEFGAQSGHAVMAPMGLLGAKTTRGFSQSAEPEIALAQLLDGSGLTYRKTGDTFAIVSASDPQSGSAAGAGAEGTVQALIVTAQKREENIQDVPIAMSAFSQESLTKSQIAGGADLMTQVPNMTFTKTNFTSYSIQIRGIGTQAISATTDPAVAVAFNNTPFIANHFFEQEFYDLERVEVLRGPQGTLYGRNATAGVVNIISAKPKNHYEAKLSGDLANYNSSRLEGMINIPLVEDKAALRIAGAWTKRDGFVKNILTGQPTDGRDLWSGRVSLGLTPTDKFTANLIYEHFEENDDRLRSGKQLCHKDLGPATINGVPVKQTADPLFGGPAVAAYWSQGCKPASLYSPESFDTPNGYALAYYGAAAGIGAPVYQTLDPYRSSTQSRNLREIETHLKPEYDAAADTIELQMAYDLTAHLSLTSETGFSRDHIFSFEDFNRFDTTPGVFRYDPSRPDLVSADGVFCDPQLGCTNRLAAGDLAMADSQQFSQEFRLTSSFEGPLNFSFGANFLRYDTEINYYVFINSLTALTAIGAEVYVGPWNPGVTTHEDCFTDSAYGVGLATSNPNIGYGLAGCAYVDPNGIHNLNEQGRNYFLSKNPYHLLSYATFGEAYWQVAPDLKVTGGLRWTIDRKTAPQIPSWLLAANTYGTPTRKVIEQEWREPTGRLAIDWKPHLDFTDQTLLYASYVRGYKAGGANPPPAIPVFPPINFPIDLVNAVVTESNVFPTTFRPEFVNAYEVGTKNTLLDGRLTLNSDVFYYDYTGYQISEIVDRSSLNLNFDAKIWGAELEIAYSPLENLQLGFKGGYENTRLAKGSRGIDLMDRTAGDPNYLVHKPFPTFSSNCIVPLAHAFQSSCEGYKLDLNPYNVPNNGGGVSKDLSGNMLPNAPKFTATVTTDYTLPLPDEWLMTLHADLYYQSEAWTRVFNTPGYDKLKAFNNINVAAIFSNEDRGWTVMAYVKNLQDKDNITGAFLNSDDTGLTTNVFLTEPRLYGLRVTKNWTGAAPFGDLLGHHAQGQPYPFRIEVGGLYGPFSGGRQILAPSTVALFPTDMPYPLGIQSDLDWGSAGSGAVTWQPRLNAWFLRAAVRYGRASGAGASHAKQPVGSGAVYFGNYYGFPVDPSATNHIYNYTDSTSSNDETHAVVDFLVGREFGIGALSGKARANLSVGGRYLRLNSTSNVTMHGQPDLHIPPTLDFFTAVVTEHRLQASEYSAREFEGAGVVAEWDVAVPLVGEQEEYGHFGLDFSLGGSVVWGKQATEIEGQVKETFKNYIFNADITPPYETSLAARRSKSATVPSLSGAVGLSYEVGRMKVSSGYHWERFFDAVDGGIEARRTFDRDLRGPYFKVSVGFGG